MLSDDFKHNIDNQEKLGGIEVFKLRPGTKLEVLTQNSLYRLEILGEAGCVALQGGKFFREQEPAIFDGSTWGGSAIKIGWIGFGMRMELRTRKRKLITSPVEAARVIGDGWDYNMEWPVV